MHKVMAIGLDGTSWDLITPWMQSGHLPNFKRLMQAGTCGVLRTTIPCITCPALPSFYTGKNPGNIGLFAFNKPDGSFMTYRDINSRAIWEILSQNGKKCGVFNLRTTYPPQPTSGIILAGTHNPTKQTNYIYPEGLRPQVSDFHITMKDLTRINIDLLKSKREAVEGLMRITRNRFRIATDFLDKEDFDFFLLWIEHSDSIQHWSWHRQDYILDFFKMLDGLIAEIMEKYSRDHNIFFLSDHGFGGYKTREFFVNSWLRKEGYLRMQNRRLAISTYYGAYNLASRLFGLGSLGMWLRVYSKILVKLLFKYVGKKGPRATGHQRRILASKRRFLFGVDWQNSLAYSDLNWCIRLNEKGLTQSEKDRITGEIIDKLQNLYDSEGNKVVKEALRREKIYEGRYLAQLPEIIILYNKQYAGRNTLTRKITRRITHPSKVGSHQDAIEAIIMATGPDVRKEAKIQNANIYDLTPTFLHLMGEAVPDDMDGKVLKEFFDEGSEAYAREVRYGPGEGLIDREAHVMDKKERKEMEKSLRALGYID
jgi:predicted AlkP superfamily phosphohydrolase/phosphomutase